GEAPKLPAWKRSVCSFAVALPVATSPLSALAYRTAADLEEFDGQRVAWRNSKVAFELNAPSIPEGIEHEIVVAAVEAALSEWTKPECSTIAPELDGLTEVAVQPMDGANTISWVSSWSDRGFRDDAAGSTDVQYMRDGGVWE